MQDRNRDADIENRLWTQRANKKVGRITSNIETYIIIYSSVGIESACNAGDLSSVPGLGRSPGEGNGYPLQYSCLENPMDRGGWQPTVHGVARVGYD